jgi:DmsE family decaheme c-type cytochrome
VEASFKKIIGLVAVVLAAAATGASILLADPQTPDAEAPPRVSQACLDCHEGYDAGLAATPHHISPEAPDGPGAAVACTDCHGGDPRHYQEDPEAFPMILPSALDADSAAVVCSACHMNSHQQNLLEKNVHTRNDVNCAGCHKVHDTARDGLLKAAEPGLCIDCHSKVEGEFARPFRHPVADGVMACSECHMTLDVTSRELSRNGTNVCFGCHGEFRGPFPFEHQATVDYSTEEGACITCHNPHGSVHPRMLEQPYEAPHFQLCSQCHSVPGHNFNTRHGSTFAGIPCNDCHTDIHGSYVSRNFLTPSLQAQGCFNAGCHQF